MQKAFTKDFIKDYYDRAEFVNSNPTFLRTFELAIDNLRCGRVQQYNFYARGNFKQIPLELGNSLKPLQDPNYKRHLIDYKNLVLKLQEINL